MKTKQKAKCKECSTYKTADCFNPRCAQCIADKKHDPRCGGVSICRKLTTASIEKNCGRFKIKIGDWDE